MLLNSSRRLCLSSMRSLSTSSAVIRPVVQQLPIKTTVEGNKITIEATPSTSFASAELAAANIHGACPLCQLNTEIYYEDVLILRQFMRSDGTVLPRELTGLCEKQQTVVEQAVMQAHWSGLFPSNKLPAVEGETEPAADYTLFQRHWKTNSSMWERRLETRVGTWKYSRMFERYNNPYHPHQKHLAQHVPDKNVDEKKTSD